MDKKENTIDWAAEGWLLWGWFLSTVGTLCFSPMRFVASFFTKEEAFLHMTYQWDVVFHCWLLGTLFHVYQRSPRRPVGLGMKVVMDVMAVCSAIALNLFLEHSIVSLVALVAFTLEFHSARRLICHSDDFGFLDQLLGAVMQISVYLGRAHDAVVMLCVFVISFRFWRSYHIMPDLL